MRRGRDLLRLLWSLFFIVLFFFFLQGTDRGGELLQTVFKLQLETKLYVQRRIRKGERLNERKAGRRTNVRSVDDGLVQGDGDLSEFRQGPEGLLEEGDVLLLRIT